jgi:hypothetical protein
MKNFSTKMNRMPPKRPNNVGNVKHHNKTRFVESCHIFPVSSERPNPSSDDGWHAQISNSPLYVYVIASPDKSIPPPPESKL